MIIGDLLRKNAREIPQKIAVISGDTGYKYRYEEFNERVNRLAKAFFELGIKKGDRIAVLQHNCTQYVEIFFACAKTGVILVPLNFRLASRELMHIINDAEPGAMIVGKEYIGRIDSMIDDAEVDVDMGREKIISIGNDNRGLNYERLVSTSYSSEEPVEDRDRNMTLAEDDVMTIIYTSGTTGLPKGVVQTHKNLLTATKNVLATFSIVPQDITLLVTPFFHVTPIWPMLSHLYVGGTSVVMRRFEPGAVLKKIEEEHVTNVNVVPIMILRMLECPEIKRCDISSLKWISYGAAPMPVELLKRAISVFGNIFIQVYGLTESYILSYLPQEDHIDVEIESNGGLKKISSCGKPMVNCDVRVVNEARDEVSQGEIGEIIARGDSIIERYWNKPEETANTFNNGWLYTGDIATVDKAGYIYILDRKKDMIISGGENIYPREVEEVIYKHPAVREAAVIGVSDEEWGESVCAYVVVKDGEKVSEDEIVGLCVKELANYKKPRFVEFIHSLPRTESGKVLKREIKEMWKNKKKKY
jgi:acyl-CoA synthetase (AMP-forming)/AMP-acid ligase II